MMLVMHVLHCGLCSEHLNAFGGCEGLGFMVRAVRLGGGVVT